ncbi:MAG: acylphosphatase, partial [Candidatus Hermodarchaeota archaeon]
MRAEIIIKGIVQGVGFRPFVYRIALGNRLVGYVRNRGDAGVEIVVEGSESDVERFIVELNRDKPPLSQIYDLFINYVQDRGSFSRFQIVRSFEGGSLSGSIIPYDVSICDKCLMDLRDPRNRRYGHF